MEDLAAADRALVVSRGLQPGNGDGAGAEAEGDLRPVCRGVLDRRLRARAARPRPDRRPDRGDPAGWPDGRPASTPLWPAWPARWAGRRSSAARRLPAASDNALALPRSLPEALTPLLFIVPGQLLVEATAQRRGLSPDAPDGLGKVTLNALIGVSSCARSRREATVASAGWPGLPVEEHLDDLGHAHASVGHVPWPRL